MPGDFFNVYEENFLKMKITRKPVPIGSQPSKLQRVTNPYGDLVSIRP